MAEKYLRTFYNDEKVIMKLNGCQFCPLMRFDMINTRCLCRYFSNEFQDTVVEVFVIDYSDKGVVEDKIKIPKWCGLPNTIEELIKERTTFRSFPSTILVNEDDNCDDNELPFIDAEQKKNEEDVLMEKFMIQLSKRPSWRKEFDEEVDIHRSDFSSLNVRDFTNSTEYDEEIYGYQSSIIKQEVCSLCGEEDETVDRKEKNGMCDDCWNEYQFDEEKKKQAFINNFRMKRNKDFPKESYKII
jgi:hypothetical protein